MFVVGTASHSLDFRKSAGGFIHGFRYTGETSVHSVWTFYSGFNYYLCIFHLNVVCNINLIPLVRWADLFRSIPDECFKLKI